LSANLALVNVLPFPPLDGGRMAILVAKRIAGKRGVSAVERTSYAVGFALLMASWPGSRSSTSFGADWAASA